MHKALSLNAEFKMPFLGMNKLFSWETFKYVISIINNEF